MLRQPERPERTGARANVAADQSSVMLGTSAKHPVSPERH